MSSVAKSRHPSKTNAAVGAMFAVLFWSLAAWLFCALRAVPGMQLLATTQILGGIMVMLFQRRPEPLLERFLVVLRYWPPLLLMFLNQLFYNYAFRLSPPALVDLINYLWPMMLVLGEAIGRRERLSWWQVGGLTLGVAALGMLVGKDLSTLSFSMQFLWGCALALGAALTWAAYSYFNKRMPYGCRSEFVVGEQLVLVGGLSAIIATASHSWAPVSGNQIILMIALATSVYGLAYPLWMRGVAYGNYAVIGGIANTIPALSVAWLVVGRISPPSLELWLACAMVAMGCLFMNRKHASVLKKELHSSCSAKRKRTTMNSLFAQRASLHAAQMTKQMSRRRSIL